MGKRTALIFMLGLATLFRVWSGDIASYVNLGFSPDSRYFMFGQYGIEEAASLAYADLFLVDVPANTFVRGGTIHGNYPISLQPTQTGSGALYIMLESSADLVAKHRIDHLQQGRLLYILVNGEPPKSLLEFRDFVTGTGYRVSLEQQSSGTGKDISASFHIRVTLTRPDGSQRTYAVGKPDYRREGVKQYRIRQIVLSPKGEALVFLVEKEQIGKTGTDIRYMVETLALK